MLLYLLKSDNTSTAIHYNQAYFTMAYSWSCQASRILNRGIKASVADITEGMGGWEEGQWGGEPNLLVHTLNWPIAM